MEDMPFKPAGVAFAAVVAGLGAGAVAPAVEPAAPAKAGFDVTALPAAEPLGAGDLVAELNAANADVPLAEPVQLSLPLGRG